MTTKIPVELSSTPGIVDGSNATAITIDSSENVLVGTTTFNNLSTESGVLASNNVVMARGGLADHQDACAVLQYSSDTTWLRAYGDTAGSGLMVFRTGGGAGSTDAEAMRIDSSGHVTKAKQSYFGARRNGNQTGYNASGDYSQSVIFNLEFETDANADYNTSNGLFTCPVDGHYIFMSSVYSTSMTAMSQMWLTVNGARGQFTDIIASGTVISGMWIVKLDANDTVGIHPYQDSKTSETILDSNNHTYFRGGLLY